MENCFCVEFIPGDATAAQAEDKHGFRLSGAARRFDHSRGQSYRLELELSEFMDVPGTTGENEKGVFGSGPAR